MARNAEGNLTYEVVRGADGNPVALSDDAKQLTAAIDDHSIVVGVDATNNKTTSTGALFVGGAFMGNTVKTFKGVADIEVNTVHTKQEINPNVLETLDNAYVQPGVSTLHEVTESYKGGLISQKSGISSPNANGTGTVYPTAPRFCDSSRRCHYSSCI